MQIFSNAIKFNIPYIASIKNVHGENFSSLQIPNDTVSFGANINYEKAKNIYSAIGKSRRVAILVHKDADADALSSGILFLNLLKRRYKDKDIQLVINQKIPKYLAALPDLSVIKQYNDLEDKKFDTVAILDCDESRVDCYDIFEKADVKINIDHHKNRKNNLNFTKGLRLLDFDAVSTTQVIYDNFVVPFGFWLNKPMIECVLTGIVTDSGNFKNIPDSKKFSKTMNLLAQYSKTPLPILTKKINNKFKVSKQRSKELEKFFADSVESGKNLRTHITPNNNKVNYVLLNKEILNEYNIKDNEADIKETLNHIATSLRVKSDIAATLWERENGEIRLSMRSNYYNVLSLAEKFGGGGHNLAAGATISGTFEEASEKFLKALDENY